MPAPSDQWAAPFNLSPFRLRFELGGEIFGSEAPVPRFMQAFDRARQLTYEAFEESERVIGIVACGADSANDICAPAEDGWASLRDMGFIAPAIAEWQAPLWPDQEAGKEDEDESDGTPPDAAWRAFDLSDSLVARDILIWCAVAYELRIQPKAPVFPYFVDPDRHILVNIYDDRGMDVIALAQETLLPLCQARDEWLLDYDRARIAAAFGTGD